MKSKINQSGFDRGGRLILGIALFLFLGGVLELVLLFTLPTDGWFTKPPDPYGTIGFIYSQNLMGVPSQLQPNDHAIAIAGISLAQQDLSALSSTWRAGNSVVYTVERNGTRTDVSVPLVQWQVVPALIFWVEQLGIASAVGQFAFLAIAAFAFYKRPDDHAARTLLLFAVLFPTLGAFIQSFMATPSAAVFAPISILGIVTLVLGYTVLFPPILINFALVFPHPKPLLIKHPRLEYVPYLVGVLVLPLFALTNGGAGYVWTIVSILATIVILVHSAFTMRDALSRAQLLWGLWGVIVGMLLFLSTYLVTFGIVSGIWADVANGLTSLSFSVLGITLGIAILRYRLWDIGIIIRRTLTYGLVTALLAVVFFGSIVLLQQVFANLTGANGSELVTVLSTLAIAALFVPLRNRVQTAIDRRFNRKKYDAQQVLSDFGKTVRDETDLEKLTGRLVQVVDETMQPKSVSVWLKPAREQRKNSKKYNFPRQSSAGLGRGEMV